MFHAGRPPLYHSAKSISIAKTKQTAIVIAIMYDGVMLAILHLHQLTLPLADAVEAGAV